MSDIPDDAPIPQEAPPTPGSPPPPQGDGFQDASEPQGEPVYPDPAATV